MNVTDNWQGTKTIWDEVLGFGLIGFTALLIGYIWRNETRIFWRASAIGVILTCLDDPFLAILALWRSQMANMVFHLFFAIVLVVTYRLWRSGYWKRLDMKGR